MRYSQTIFTDGHRAFGKRLLPMTLGHAVLLERIGNPFGNAATATDPTPIQADEALTCALVCSRPWHDAARMVNSWRGGVWLRVNYWRYSHLMLVNIIALRRYHAATW